MDSTQPKLVSRAIAVLLTLVFGGPAAAQPSVGNDWEKFFQEKVSFGGFIENTTGFSISHGSRFFNTSNRFIMNRFTVQPEFNFDFAESFKVFLSWRFVAEPRYSAETKSREAAVQPAGTGRALPADFYSEYKAVPWEAVADILPTEGLHLRVGRQFISWGETDGQRLLDIINPQNLTFSPPAAVNLFSLKKPECPSGASECCTRYAPSATRS